MKIGKIGQKGVVILLKYENVDIIATLGAIMEINTGHYKSDFQYDIEMFQEAAFMPNGENNNLLWLSRPNGTECFLERNVSIKGTSANHVWCYYVETKDNILAYAVEIVGLENGLQRNIKQAQNKRKKNTPCHFQNE